MPKPAVKTRRPTRTAAEEQGTGSRSSRSRAYPAVDLRTAIQLVKLQIDALGKGSHDRDTIARALGHAKSSGPAARKIAAMGHYGLLERRQGLYRPTPLAHRLLDTSDLASLRAARREALLEPALFRELFDKYRPMGRIPSLLGQALFRDHGISESAQEDAASIFRESGLFAAILDTDGYFEGPRPAPIDPARPAEADTAMSTEPALGPSSSTGEQVVSLQLTHGWAELRLPSYLTPIDIQRLKLQLDVFAFDGSEKIHHTAPSKVVRPDFGK